MGLDVNGVKFLLFARKEGVSFETTATLGRQELLLKETALADLLERFGEDLTRIDLDEIYSGSNGFSDGVFKTLGAHELTSFDASEYQGVSTVHDFNLPIIDEYKGRFSAVLDGGTLEHIFNFPQAVSNCMNMVAEGGHFLAITPTNNHSGHGFYQFSPELFFRIFSPENGFELQHLIVFEETAGCTWYEVTDPKMAGERVSIRNNVPTMLLVIAKKVATVEVFRTPPQQSDYVAAWSERAPGKRPAAVPNESGRNILSRTLMTPLRAVRRLRMIAGRKFGLLERRRDHFRRLDI
jgi:hypothetical protein